MPSAIGFEELFGRLKRKEQAVYSEVAFTAALVRPWTPICVGATLEGKTA
jgi:hypothetical protein